MSLRENKAPKRGAKLTDDGRIEIRADQSTVVVRKVRDSDRIEYPDLFAISTERAAGNELAPKKRRKKKVADESQADS